MRNWNFTKTIKGHFLSTEATWHVSRMGCRLNSGWNKNFSFENIAEVHASYPSHLPAASNSWCLTNPEWCGWPQTQHVPWLLSPMALKARMSSSEHLLGLRGRHGTAEVLPLLVAISWQRCGHCMGTTLVSPEFHVFTESLFRVSGTPGNCRCDWPRGKGWTDWFIFDSLIQVQQRRLQGLGSIGGLVALSGWCSEARRRVADGFGWPVSPAVHGSEQKCTGLVTFTIFSSYTLITYTCYESMKWIEVMFWLFLVLSARVWLAWVSGVRELRCHTYILPLLPWRSLSFLFCPILAQSLGCNAKTIELLKWESLWSRCFIDTSFPDFIGVPKVLELSLLSIHHGGECERQALWMSRARLITCRIDSWGNLLKFITVRVFTRTCDIAWQRRHGGDNHGFPRQAESLWRQGWFGWFSTWSFLKFCGAPCFARNHRKRARCIAGFGAFQFCGGGVGSVFDPLKLWNLGTLWCCHFFFCKLQVWCDDLSTLQTGDKAWGMWGRASDFGAPKQPKGDVHNLQYHLSGNIERETSHAIIFPGPWVLAHKVPRGWVLEQNSWTLCGSRGTLCPLQRGFDRHLTHTRIQQSCKNLCRKKSGGWGDHKGWLDMQDAGRSQRLVCMLVIWLLNWR